MKKKWTTYDYDYGCVQSFMKSFGLSELIVRALINRGVDTDEKIRTFLDPKLTDLYDPYLLKGVEAAVSRIKEAIEKKQHICIYGDYDVDGVTSTASMITALRTLGADVSYYIPKRLEEGYGLSIDGIRRLAERNTDLIISVDCGIRSVDVVEEVNALGMDIIITDHHECGEVLPASHCIINPHQPDCSYPNKSLAGVGVALKLIQALSKSFMREGLLEEVIEFAAIGTVADVVPLLGENRIIVKNGLEHIANTKNIGLRALIEVSGLADKNINAYSIAFMIAPRINAAGRVADAELGVELLLTEDADRARIIAAMLDSSNKERQHIESRILDEAILRIERMVDFEKDVVIVADEHSWHPGVVGIVASRIVERYHLPTILISKEDGIGKGSARSIPGVNIYEAMSRCSDLFDKFGGHELAAGLTIKEENIDELRCRINEAVRQVMGEEKLLPEITVDYKLSPRDIGIRTVNQLNMLEPFGMGNPNPLFVYRNLTILSMRLVGNDSKHLSAVLHDGINEIKCIGFNLGKLYNSLSIGKKIDIICSMEINTWNNNDRVQLNIKDIKPTKNKDGGN